MDFVAGAEEGGGFCGWGCAGDGERGGSGTDRSRERGWQLVVGF